MKQVAWIYLTALLLAAAVWACGSGSETGGDEDTEGKKAAAGDEQGIWKDTAQGLTWQDPLPQALFTWQEAADYCENLTLAGISDWRLPTVNELRALVRGCPATQTGGACGLTDTCWDSTCFDNQCHGCSELKGPGQRGCYWDSALQGGCLNPFWSSLTDVYHTTNAWLVYYSNGAVDSGSKDGAHYVRCARKGI